MTENLVNTLPTPSSESPVVSSSFVQSVVAPAGYKAALIATAINAGLTVLIVNFLGVLGSGIFLGLTKEKGKRTNLVFYILTVIFFLVLELTKGIKIYDDKAKQVFIFVFNPLFLAAFPLGIAFIVRKIFKR